MKLEFLAPKTTDKTAPFFPIGIPAGPAKHIEQEFEEINIDKYIREGRDHVIYCRATGISMQSRREMGINNGDVMAVIRSGFAEPGDIVIAEINGEFTIKKLMHRAHSLYLVPANENYPTRKILAKDDFKVFAVVDTVIHKVKRAA